MPTTTAVYVPQLYSHQNILQKIGEMLPKRLLDFWWLSSQKNAYMRLRSENTSGFNHQWDKTVDSAQLSILCFLLQFYLIMICHGPHPLPTRSRWDGAGLSVQVHGIPLLFCPCIEMHVLCDIVAYRPENNPSYVDWMSHALQSHLQSVYVPANSFERHTKKYFGSDCPREASKDSVATKQR